MFSRKNIDTMTLEELKDRVDAILVELQDEKVAMFSCRTKEESSAHYNNIAELRNELKYALDKIREIGG